MKTALFLGPDFHQRTRSSDFIKDLIRERFHLDEVCVNFDGCFSNEESFEKLRKNEYDYLLVWQVRLSSKALSEIRFERGVYFPMYDSASSFLKTEKWWWCRRFKIISFCRKLHTSLLRIGLDSQYFRYFPSVPDLVELGSIRKAFYWRRRDWELSKIGQILVDLGVKELHIHDAPDPDVGALDSCPNLDGVHAVTLSHWFSDRAELDQKIQESAIYIAPREKEGIGMSFLEAMAMGRCVVAPDAPSMNEYIENQRNGILYNLTDVTCSQCAAIEEIQKNAIADAKKMRSEWLENRDQILAEIDQPIEVSRFRFIGFLSFRLLRKPSILLSLGYR